MLVVGGGPGGLAAALAAAHTALVERYGSFGGVITKAGVDATGDADVAFRAGAPCHTRPRGSVMGVTGMLSCSGVDKADFRWGPTTRAGSPAATNWLRGRSRAEVRFADSIGISPEVLGCYGALAYWSPAAAWPGTRSRT